jgi:small multidrug resistance family-3 protein
MEKDDNGDDMAGSAVKSAVRMAAASIMASVAAASSSSSSSLSNDQQQDAAAAAAATSDTNHVDTVNDDSDVDSFTWTIQNILLSLTLFVLAGLAEIGGGWLVWKAVRGTNKEPYWWAIVGSVVLIIYGFLPTLQPTDSFGRIYAVYGGFFIVLSFLAGWLLDGDVPDKGDVVGGIISMVGVLIILFWPR